jgi:hypothetical protein
MEPTPAYFQASKKLHNSDMFRNCWYPEYDVCLSRAARKDLLLDCKTCFNKDKIVDEFSFWVKDGVR